MKWIQIYINRARNRITFQIKSEYCLEVLTIEEKIPKYKNGQNIPSLEVTEVLVVHSNLVNNIYQQCSTSTFIFLNKFNSEFSYTEVWFTNQNSRPLEIGDSMNLTLVIDYMWVYNEIFNCIKKSAIQKTAEANGGVIGKRILDQLTKIITTKTKDKKYEKIYNMIKNWYKFI